jgi:hypothetical protein
MQVTWNFLAQMSVVIAQYAMPMRRFSSLISTPDYKVTPDRISRYFGYTARRLAPIYIHLLKSLANSDILAGDDTQTRVLEVKRALKEGTIPWQDYQDKSSCETLVKHGGKKELDALTTRIGLHFDFVSQSKITATAKRQLNTTVIHGRTQMYDPKTTIVIFRSHFGSFGNLVQQLLAYRHRSAKTLTIVSDLISSNLVSSQNFHVIQSGCVSHARRRFKKAQDDFKDWADLFLSYFGSLYTHEEALDISGRNADNSAAVRQTCSAKVWAEMIGHAEQVIKKFSKSTAIGDAASYLINNKNELMQHLSDYRVPMTNDLSERLLRPEKQIQSSALFRDCIEGRQALDVIRSLIQTAVAANKNATAYVEWALKQDERDVEAHPEKFTPYAFLAQG